MRSHAVAVECDGPASCKNVFANGNLPGMNSAQCFYGLASVYSKNEHWLTLGQYQFNLNIGIQGCCTVDQHRGNWILSLTTRARSAPVLL